MNLAEIRNAGGFVSDEPVKVSIGWGAHKFDVFVKRLSFGQVENLFTSDDRSKSARMIAASVLLGEDREPITYEDAYRLDPTLAAKLIEAINTVNGKPGN